MDCIYCGATIPQARLDVLPDVETCVKCSDEVCYVPAHYSGGTAGAMKNTGFNVVRSKGKGSLVHNARMAGRFRPFGGKTAQDFGSQAWWKGKNTD